MKYSFSILLFCLLIAFYANSQAGDNVPVVTEAKYVPYKSSIAFKVGMRTIPVTILQYGQPNGIVCINVHDNETASVEGAKAVLELTGGTLIKIENNKQRVVKFKLNGVTYGFDPNRIYSRIGIGQTLRDNRKYSKAAMEEIEKFAQSVLSLIPDTASCVVALHNNTDEAFSIKSYMTGGNRQRDAKAVYANPLEDIDDIILTTDSLLYQQMADAGYNSIWQDNERAKRDGSLSIYYGERSRRYINIETQHGKVEQYRVMFEKLQQILAGEKKDSPETASLSQ
ncbi:MAG: hypothetical protein JNK27_13745 [Chitinophagaceae bacterium]|nr:hypothetical protein [Chitinophagaceae bacterium]